MIQTTEEARQFAEEIALKDPTPDYTVLSFGFVTAPRVFTKYDSVITSYQRL